MSLKKWAVFRADDFPDDTVETELDIITFPGRNIAEALQAILAAIGCTDIGEPLDRAEHGWHLYFRFEGKECMCQVSRIEPETLLLFEKIYESGRFFRRGPSPREQMAVHAKLLECLSASLQADKRFRELAWYTQQDMDKGNWLLPIESAAEGA